MNRRLAATGAALFLLALALMLLAPPRSAQAQQTEPRLAPTAQSVPGDLPLHERIARRPSGGFPTVTIPDEYRVLDPVQSFNLNSNPVPARNFSVLGTAERAGDVNGDGNDDYVYTAGAARDERTPGVLEDVVGKTALFFGSGAPSQAEDQLLYHELHPTGDLDGDGFSDAVERVDSTTVRFFTGSVSGYADSGVSLTLSLENVPFSDSRMFVGFTDFDGDGFADVLSKEGTHEQFEIVFGAADLADAEARVYETPGAEIEPRTLNAADLDGDGRAAVVELSGQSVSDGGSGITVEVFRFDATDRSRISAQQFSPPQLENGANHQRLSLIDIDGDGLTEISVCCLFDGTSTDNYVFSQQPDGSYGETPITFTGGSNPDPVGDLDGDGRHDFYDNHAIFFGPADLQDGLTDSTAIDDPESVYGGVDFNPYGGLGDLDGDGLDDAMLGYHDDFESVGRAILYGATDRSALASPTDVAYPYEHFFDPIYSTNEAGDLDGDGAEDFVVTRNDLGRVEVFFGGASISDTPDLTLQAPPGEEAMSTAAGDFNGDDASDLAVSSREVVRVYFGGSGFDATADHAIDLTDFSSNPSGQLFDIENIGDVNGDGFDDLLLADGFSGETYFFFGAASLSSTPSITISEPAYAASITTIGDFNADGFDDFALGKLSAPVKIYFGNATPSFGSPDLEITLDNFGLVGGDFNGDGVGDLAAKPLDPPNAENIPIDIYHGGSNPDAVADRRLEIPVDALGVDPALLDFLDSNGDGLVESSVGELSAVPGPGGAPDKLVLTSANGSNALIYDDIAPTDRPTAVLRGPNQDESLNGSAFINLESNIAVGDFDGDGQTDLVLSQPRDDNDATQSSRFYRWSLPTPLPVELASFTARADEQDAILEWQTLTETNSDGFRVERRRPTDDVGATGRSPEWTRVAFIESKAEGGTSQEPLRYEFRVEGLDYGSHTFRLVQTDIGGGETPVGEEQAVEIGLSGAYELSEASPNPIREQGSFDLTVREAQDVSVALYDALGRRVRVVRSGPMAAQQTERFTLEAGGLASGVYFVRVIGEDFAATRRAVVID